MARGPKAGGELQLRPIGNVGARIIVGLGNINKDLYLLKWLFKNCELAKGDSVLLLHVMTNFNSNQEHGEFDDTRESIFSYISTEVSYLLLKFNVPKVSLSLRVVGSPEIHTVIISEAQRIHATAILLGSCSRLFQFRASDTIRKQCVEHLPAFCSIMVLLRNRKLSVETGAAPANVGSTLRKLLTTESVDKDSYMKADVAEVQAVYNGDEISGSYLASSVNGNTGMCCTVSPATDSETQFSYLSSFTSNGSFAKHTDSPLSVLSSSRRAGSRKVPETKAHCKRAYIQEMVPKGDESFGHDKVTDWLQSDPSICQSIKCSEQNHIRDVEPLLESEGIEKTLRYCGSESEINCGQSICELQEEDSIEKGLVYCETDMASRKKLRQLLSRTAETTVSMQYNQAGIVLEKFVFHGWEGYAQKFSFHELELATNNFSAENMIGGGGSSKVFRGQICKGRILAIKRLASTFEAQEEFFMEIGILSRIHHRHVVSLIGFCVEGFYRLLVYEFLKNGNLQQRLQDHNTILTWDVRQQVALGASRGLDYLHTSAPWKIIHRDVKTSNILLTDNFEAQISDFGYANLRPQGTTKFSVDEVIFGTFGYLAPECLVSGYCDEKTDVYSFGVVLLELISGRSSIDSSLPSNTQSLTQWALVLEKKGETYQLVDPNLTNIYLLQLKRMMYAAFQCIRSLPEERPTMRKVMKLLDPNWECTEPLLASYST